MLLSSRLQEGKPLVLECVRRAERLVLEDPNHHREYLDMGGDRDFCGWVAAAGEAQALTLHS